MGAPLVGHRGVSREVRPETPSAPFRNPQVGLAAWTGPAMNAPRHSSFGDRLVDECPDALIALSFDGRVLFWNRGAETIFGYAAAEAVGRSLEELIVPAEDREAMRAVLVRTIAEGAAQFEAVRRRRDGTLVHVE